MPYNDEPNWRRGEPMYPDPTPLELQRSAATRLGYGAIWLRRIGDKIIVQIEHAGEWRTVIVEDADANISHIVEPRGIESALANADDYRIP